MAKAFVSSFCMALCVVASVAELNLPLAPIARLAEVFGQSVYELCAKVTAVNDIRSDFLLMEPKIQAFDGVEVVKKLKDNIEKMLRKKVTAVERLVNEAENAHRLHTFQNTLHIKYSESKKVNMTDFRLVENKNFNNLPVNLTMSTVHVPTSLYERSTDVLNDIAWSAVLDEAFYNNYMNDSSLTWQYFASHSGFFRNYPGTIWQPNNHDVFDCRLLNWYTQTAASLKDVVILLVLAGNLKESSIEMAKETASKIIETLGDDDYLNVIKFASYPGYIQPCVNGTLVRATAANKKAFVSALNAVSAEDMVSRDVVIEEAFHLLNLTKEEELKSQCNRVIMLITCDASAQYSDFFTEYSLSGREVRVFTFLVGQSPGQEHELKSLACNNGGYFSEIESSGDILDRIQEYIHVLSRPMAAAKARRNIWTNVYLHNMRWDFVLSHAQPVYDISNDSWSSSNSALLGVMGTDVPVDQLSNALRQHELGVNAYAFIIMNNGHVVFHPKLNFTKGQIVNKMDMSHLEISDEIDELRTKMMNGETGRVRMSVHAQYNDMKHMLVRNNYYYFTDISGTPFRLGIAVPEGYGHAWIRGYRPLEDIDLSSLRMEVGELLLSPWNYCLVDYDRDLNSVEQLIKYLTDVKDGRASDYHEQCDNELLQSLLFDAEATRGSVTSWLKENLHYNNNIVSLTKHGAEVVFIGTRAGLTRSLSLTDDRAERYVLHSKRASIDDDYYSAAVDNGEELFTFTLAGNHELITASTPIIMTEDDSEAAVAVVGAQLRYSKFYDLFMNMTKLCSSSSNEVLCHDLCHNDELDCYLLDYNGYIVLSENREDLGKFFGEISGASFILKELIDDVESDQPQMTPRREFVFKRYKISDHQAVCESWSKSKSNSVSTFFWTITHLISALIWFLHELSLFFGKIMFITWWTDDINAENDSRFISSFTSVNGDHLEEYDFENGLMELKQFVPNYLWRTWVKEVTDMLQSDRPPDEIWNWLENIKKQYMPSTVSHRTCTKEYTYYLADSKRLPQHGTVLVCDVCMKSYSMNHVPRTNLLLLVIDSLCVCDTHRRFNTAPVEIKNNNSSVCQQFIHSSKRKHHSHCYPYNPREEPPGECAKCSLHMPIISIIVAHQFLLYCRSAF